MKENVSGMESSMDQLLHMVNHKQPYPYFYKVLRCIHERLLFLGDEGKVVCPSHFRNPSGMISISFNAPLRVWRWGLEKLGYQWWRQEDGQTINA